MKKYMLMTAAVLLLFVGCSNDDIEVITSSEVSFTVNPETVVSGFPQFNAGELLTVPSGYYVRTRLMIYDANGDYVKGIQQNLSNYGRTMKPVFELAKGDYTAVAMTCIYKEEDDDDYWTLANVSSLSTAVVISKYYNNQKLSILGLSKMNFTVTGEPTQSFLMNVYPAGALLAVEYQNNQRNIDYYLLTLSRKGTRFNLGNEYTEVSGQDNTSYAVNVLRTAGYSVGSTVQTYEFVLPVAASTVLKFNHSADLSTYTYYNKNVYTLSSIDVGEMYYCIFKIGDTVADLESEVYLQDTEYVSYNAKRVQQFFTDEDGPVDCMLSPGKEIRLSDIAK